MRPRSPWITRTFLAILRPGSPIRGGMWRNPSTGNLSCLYWEIGSTIVRQQETGTWGDGIVAQLATDLRSAFPEMKGLKKENLFRMRKFVISCCVIDRWLDTDFPQPIVDTGDTNSVADSEMVGTVSPQFLSPTGARIVGRVSPQFQLPQLMRCVTSLSWSHHYTIIARGDSPAERYFYMSMAVHERWSVRELRRRIASDLFTRYVSVRQQPEKCLPAETESGDLLPFIDHYVLDFLGLAEEHSEQRLHQAILGMSRSVVCLLIRRTWTSIVRAGRAHLC